MPYEIKLYAVLHNIMSPEGFTEAVRLALNCAEGSCAVLAIVCSSKQDGCFYRTREP